MKSSGKIVAAFLIGAAAGASLGILLAPDKGANTRRKIKEKFEDLGEMATAQLKKLKRKKQEQEMDSELLGEEEIE